MSAYRQPQGGTGPAIRHQSAPARLGQIGCPNIPTEGTGSAGSFIVVGTTPSDPNCRAAVARAAAPAASVSAVSSRNLAEQELCCHLTSI